MKSDYSGNSSRITKSVKFLDESLVIDNEESDFTEYTNLIGTKVIHVPCSNTRKLYRRLFAFIDLEDTYSKFENQENFSIEKLRESVLRYV